jgi:hypothetical protein
MNPEIFRQVNATPKERVEFGVERLKKGFNSQEKMWLLIERIKALVQEQHSKYIKIATELASMKEISEEKKVLIAEELKKIEADFFESKKLTLEVMDELSLKIEL